MHPQSAAMNTNAWLYITPPLPGAAARCSPAMKNNRVALSPSVYSQLKVLAKKRLRGVGTISRMGSIVLDNYLSHIERAYFGRPRATCCTPVPQSARDIDAVIFDMDGVLCDSEIISRQVAVDVFSTHYALSVQPHDFAPFTGRGEAAFLAGVADIYNVPDFDPEKAKDQFFDIYVNSEFINDLKAFPGVKNLISRVKQLGLKVAVASAADAVKVNANLTAIGLPRETFDFVTSSENIRNKKPAPDVFLQAAKGMNVEPSRCVVIEDATAGVEAALAAGMRCIAVATSLDKEQLESAGPHVVREQPAYIELIDLFGRDVFEDLQPSEPQAATQPMVDDP